MNVYIDESGDLGFRVHGGATPIFAISLVIVDDPTPITAALDELRHTIHKPGYEFKFMSTNDATRERFFAVLAKQAFKARCRIVDKRQLMQRDYEATASLYARAVARALSDEACDLIQATVVLDQIFPDRYTKQQLSTEIRRALSPAAKGEAVISDIHYANSRTDSLIQVADMIVGAVARSYTKGDDHFSRLIPPHLLQVGELIP